MNKKVIKLIAFCMAVVLMIFLPGLFNLGFTLYLDITMKATGKLPTVNTEKKLEKLVGDRNTYYYYDYSPITVSRPTIGSKVPVAINAVSADLSSVDSLSSSMNFFGTSSLESSKSVSSQRL